MNRMSIAEGKVNVDNIIRKIIGVEPSNIVPFNKLLRREKREYWAVANVFRNTSAWPCHGRGTAYKTGKGMKLVERFINAVNVDNVEFN